MLALNDAVSPGQLVELVKALGPAGAAVFMALSFLYFLTDMAKVVQGLVTQWATAHKEAAQLCKEAQDEQSDVIRECMSVMGKVRARDERILIALERMERRHESQQ